MKKFISIMLSLVMVLSFAVTSTMPAMAKWSSPVSGSPSGGVIGTTVNGSTTSDITYSETKNPTTITATLGGGNTASDWEFPGLNPEDYKVISKDGNKVVIELTASGENKQFTINAVVEKNANTPDDDDDNDDGVDDGDDDGEDDGVDAGNADEDESATSPATGASMAGIAVAGAGVAILTALKKRD